MRTLLRILVIVVVQSSAWAAVVQGSAVRVALLPEVVVSGDEILLSHLIAEPIPVILRERALAISFGKTPAFGSVRKLHAPLVGSALADYGLPPSDFSIPEVITVHRGGRRLSAAEVKAALSAFLQQSGADSQLRNDDLQLSSAQDLLVPENDLGLYVRCQRYDSALHRIDFSLASRVFPDLTPFTVMSYADSTVVKGQRLRTAEESRRPQPYLVQAGSPAQLVVSAADTQMTLSVVPLKSGRQGDVLRVRIAKSAKVLNAKVVSKNFLIAAY